MATVPQTAGRSPWMTLSLILSVAMILRVVAAFAVQTYTERIGKPCIFGDTAIYRELARTIIEGSPFVVDQAGIPHYALRTPGYPLFLAACRALFGPSFLAVRLIQAALGTLGVFCLYRFVDRVAPRPNHRVAIIAAFLAAVEPYGIGMGSLILSEGVFIPLMLASLWGLADLWGSPPTQTLLHKGEGDQISLQINAPSHRRGYGSIIAIATGLTSGAAILVRPSWALIVPLLLAAWIIGDRRRSVLKYAGLIALSTALVMMPWWVRNARLFGRFVPTALWVGASLYDGLSPTASGASEMSFLAEPGIIELNEPTQDIMLRRRSIDFALSHPGRAVGLAIIKAGRFWSPWPNAETLQNPVAAALSAIIMIPLFTLVAVGLWDRRRDWRAIVILAGPLLYFLVLHMVFVSSIRYRIPGFFPALGLAAIGVERIRFMMTSQLVAS